MWTSTGRKCSREVWNRGDIKSIEDIEKLPFTTKEDLKNNYPFGLLAIPMKMLYVFRGLPEQQVNSRSLRIHRKMWKCGESVWHAVSQWPDLQMRYHSRLLRLWTLHRRHGTGFRRKGTRSHCDSDVSRNTKTSDDGHGGSWCNCICMYTYTYIY